MKKITMAAALTLALCACGKTATDESGTETKKTVESEIFAETRETVSATGNGEKITLSDKNILISEAGTYTLTGTLDGGQIVVDAGDDDKVELVLENAEVSCVGSAALYVKNAKKVTLTLADGSKNRLVSSGEFVSDGENNVDGAFFSKEDVKIEGTGSLTVECESGHGIVCKDELKIKSGNIEVTAASHALQVKDGVVADGGTLKLTAGKDGIHAENSDDTTLGSVTINGGTIVIDADGDGIDSSCEVIISGGDFTVEAGDRASVSAKTDKGGFGGFGRTETTESGTSTKGIKAEKSLTITGGTFNIDSADDVLHSNGDITISDGTFTVLAGDDGVHADGLLTVSGGNITVSESYEGLEGEKIEISGGVINVKASDDGLNAAGGNDESGFGGFGHPDMFASNENNYIKISGGVINIDAGGDGIDSNGNLYVSGGETYVNGPEDGGNGALDYGGEAEITGGIFVAAGSSGMAQNFGSATQGSILVPASNTEKVTVTDSKGAEILSFTPTKKCECIVISSPLLVKGETYTVTVGESKTEVTLSDYVYSSVGGGGFGGGGFGGGPRPSGDFGGAQKPSGSFDGDRKETPTAR